MPKYQVYFDGQHGDEPYRVHIEDHEILTKVLPDILTDLRKEDGYVLPGEGDIQVVAAGRMLKLDEPLPNQGVRPNDVLRVSVTLIADQIAEAPGVSTKIGPVRAVNTRLGRSAKSKQMAYRMALAGTAGGLLAWAIFVIIAFFYVGNPLTADLIGRGIFGVLVGSIVGGVSSHCANSRVSTQQVVACAGLALALSVVAGLIQVAVRGGLGFGSIGDRLFAWMSLGAFTAVAIALVRSFRRPERIPVSFACGLGGGVIAGVLMVVSGEAPDIIAPLAYMVAAAGAGIAAPMRSFRTGVGHLQFISSGDKPTHDQHTRKKSAWILSDGQACVIGSADEPATAGSSDLPISLGDPGIALQHARIHARSGRFVLSRHVEIRNQAGIAGFVLKVHGETVLTNAELHDGDDVLLGTTTLLFNVVDGEDD